MDKKKVILYNPKAVFFDMPLALLAIGTQVCDNYEVIIIDARVEEDPLKILKENIQQAVAVGVTSLTGAPLRDAIHFSKKAKELNPNVPVIWGGWHTSLFPDQVLKEIPEVDVSVVGQGEITFKELIAAHENQTDLNAIKGIVYRKDSEIIKTPPRVISDVNELPRVNYDLIDVEKYFNAKGNRQLDFITSTGCFFRCTFCADPFVFNRKYTGLLPSRVFDDLKYYHDKYQFIDLNFQDETFFTYPKRILELAGLLKNFGSKFTWAATMRADQGNRMSLNDFKLCKESGMRRLLIGVESGSQEMMDWLKKDIKKEHVYQAANWCNQLDINVIFPFIVGFPSESEKSIVATKNMIKELAFMSKGFDTPIFYFKPYPGTKITDDVVASGEYTLPETLLEWAEFDYIGSKGPWVSEEKFNYFENLKFYLKFHRKVSKIKPLALITKSRIKKDDFRFPIEKIVIEKLRPAEKLS